MLARRSVIHVGERPLAYNGALNMTIVEAQMSTKKEALTVQTVILVFFYTYYKLENLVFYRYQLNFFLFNTS